MSRQKLILIAIYAIAYFFLIDPITRYLLFVLGLLLGLLFLLVDKRWLYQYYREESPNQLNQTENSNKPAQPPFLVTRSFLFLISLVPLSLFVVTSTGSALGSGLILGIIIGLLQEMWHYFRYPAWFNHVFMSQMKESLSAAVVRQIMWASLVYFFLLNLLVIF